MGDRSRSKSPHQRDEQARPKKTGGFRWKDKRRDDDSRDNRRLERGYRDRSRSPRRRPEGDHHGKNSRDNRERRRSDRGDDSRDGRRLERDHRGRERSQSPRRHSEGDRHGKSSRDNRDRDTPEGQDGEATKDMKETKEKKEKKVKKVISKSSEPMIVVHVNDRLGTKAAIPCLASDPISESSLLLLCPLTMLMLSLQSYSRPTSLLGLAVRPTKFFSSVKANVHLKISLHWRTMA